MAKSRIIYQCQSCGHTSPKWAGKCPDCGAWNSFVEELENQTARTPVGPSQKPVRLCDIQQADDPRSKTGIGELDRVLGGGIVQGSVVLIGGDPGIGKSTLILQALAGMTGSGDMLYVSAEESPSQIKLRAGRMQVNSPDLLILPVTSLEEILRTAAEISPALVVIDSIQMVHNEALPSAPGSVGQVREAAARLTAYAKKSGTPVLIIGHVTKDGAIAGPRVLEHIVDTVLYFEGDSSKAFRILRAVKNRFGSTNEIGVFTMTNSGLMEVNNPSELFISEHSLNVPGSVVTASVEGSRPIIVEIQSLASPSALGIPRRTTLGIDSNRSNLLFAVMEKRAGLHMTGMDIYINIVGGIKLDDTATDLGIAVATASSLKDRPIPPDTVVFGEIGLSGELRAVAQAEARVKEAAKLGFRKVVMPHNNLSRLDETYGLDIIGLRRIGEALEAVLA